jgi:hypothetical protein
MGCPVFLTPYPTSSVMRHSAAPHNVGTRGIVVRLLFHPVSFFNDSCQGAFTKPVADFHIRCIREVTLHDVGHHVGNATSRLISREGVGQFRIHDGKYGTQMLGGTETQFLECLCLGNYRIARTLASGSRDSQHHGYFQRFLHLGTTDKEIPEVPIIEGSGSNGLCRIYDRTTSHRKHHIHLLTTAKLNTFVHLTVNGIGLDTSHFAISHTGFLQVLLHSIQQTTPYNRTASIYYHHFLCTILTRQCTDLHFSILAKDKLCRTIKNKIIHCIPYLMYRLYLSKKRPNAPHFISPFSKTKIPSNAQEMPSITSIR